jgi:cytochrome c556
MRKVVLLGAVALIATVGLARADAPSPTELRQVGNDLMSGTFAGIRAVVAAKGDVKTLESSAKAIARWAPSMPSLFPKGSEAGTKAKPEIWTDMEGFQKAAANLGAAATKLAELAKAGDAEGVEAQIKVVGGACAACHNGYRAK